MLYAVAQPFCGATLRDVPFHPLGYAAPKGRGAVGAGLVRSVTRADYGSDTVARASQRCDEVTAGVSGRADDKDV